MPSIEIDLRIMAPPERVFATLSDIEAYRDIQPDIIAIEFLSDQRSGVGTRFRETRRSRGKEVSVTLEIVEQEAPHRLRIVCETHGTVWDSVYTVRPGDGASHLRLTMDARAQKLLPRLMNPLIMGFVRKAIVEDMARVQTACEAAA